MSKLAFLFPGQGAQTVGMGRVVIEKCPRSRELFDQAASILGYDLLKICLEGPTDQLDKTEISQPAIFVTSLAALEALRQESPDVIDQCALTAGLSLGEYTALVFAGAMTFEDGLRVVQRRGQVMQAAADKTPSGMVSVLMMERPQVEDLCKQASDLGVVQIANFLCPGNLVVSGTKQACAKVTELAEQAGGRTVQLAVAGAFHTSIMAPADAQLAEALQGVPLTSPRIPVYSNVDAQPHHDPEEIRRILVRQVVNPVLWEDSMRALLAAGMDRFYEIGPGKVARGLMKRIDRKVECLGLNEV
ncbi:MAG: ACP S-malonyltransferase [Planctomycetales bacterium]